jgi:hypothetical protein
MSNTTNHALTITTTYVDQAKLGVKTLTLGFLPDSFRLPIKSEYERIPFPLTASQALVYQGTTPPEINFSVKIVAGLDDFHVIRASKGGQQETQQLDYLDRLKLLSQELYSLALPESSIYGTGSMRPPPKSVLTVGSMFRGAGVFDSVEIEFFGPYDERGRPNEIEVNFSFLPSQFYDPSKGGNPVGINMTSAASADDKKALSGVGELSSGELNNKLALAPSGAAIDAYKTMQPYVIYYGGQ